MKNPKDIASKLSAWDKEGYDIVVLKNKFDEIFKKSTSEKKRGVTSSDFGVIVFVILFFITLFLMWLFAK